jgi:hypothetical protein
MTTKGYNQKARQKKRLGPWVKLKIQPGRCGMVKNWNEDPALVQLGADGPFERIEQDELDLISEQEFKDWMNRS